jgi:hypothetical protein
MATINVNGGEAIKAVKVQRLTLMKSNSIGLGLWFNYSPKYYSILDGQLKTFRRLSAYVTLPLCVLELVIFCKEINV